MRRFNTLTTTTLTWNNAPDILTVEEAALLARVPRNGMSPRRRSSRGTQSAQGRAGWATATPGTGVRRSRPRFLQRRRLAVAAGVTTFSKQFAGIMRLVGLQGEFRFHDSRHAFASIALKNGTSVKEVSALLGHSSPMLTLSTYAHTMEGMGREAVNGLAKSLLTASQGQTPP